MRTRTPALLAGLLLAIGASIGLSTPPTEAAPTTPDAPEAVAAPDTPERVLHNADNTSAWYCAAHRPTGYTLIHSWPYALWDGGVGYWCIAGFYGRNYQYWVHVEPPGSANSWRPWAYQLCPPTEGWVSSCTGPKGTHP
jgi:hypothetical protein